MNKPARPLLLGCAALAAASLLLPGAPGSQPDDMELLKRIAVPADAGWVDTGIDVLAGEGFYFKAGGEVSLQRGNPSANCGPAGLDLMTVQQPVPDHNLGALIGKVAQLIGVRTDEDTGAEIRDEIAAYFFIGPENGLSVPFKGRLYLGLNENVIKDNGGEFTVQVFRRKA